MLSHINLLSTLLLCGWLSCSTLQGVCAVVRAIALGPSSIPGLQAKFGLSLFVLFSLLCFKMSHGVFFERPLARSKPNTLKVSSPSSPCPEMVEIGKYPVPTQSSAVRRSLKKYRPHIGAHFNYISFHISLLFFIV